MIREGPSEVLEEILRSQGARRRTSVGLHRRGRQIDSSSARWREFGDTALVGESDAGHLGIALDWQIAIARGAEGVLAANGVRARRLSARPPPSPPVRHRALLTSEQRRRLNHLLLEDALLRAPELAPWASGAIEVARAALERPSLRRLWVDHPCVRAACAVRSAESRVTALQRVLRSSDIPLATLVLLQNSVAHQGMSVVRAVQRSVWGHREDGSLSLGLGVVFGAVLGWLPCAEVATTSPRRIMSSRSPRGPWRPELGHGGSITVIRSYGERAYGERDCIELTAPAGLAAWVAAYAALIADRGVR